jgi:DNA-directed RNA polymerase subunit RPC12/RpoP
MSKPTYFVQVCPTCGRSLEIRVDYLGRRVMCQHCQGKFLASDSRHAYDLSDSGVLMRRAEELLEQSAHIQAAQQQGTPAAP